MPVIRHAEAPRFGVDHAGATFVGLAAPSRGSKETSVWEVTVPANEVGVEHSIDHEEVFVVLAGRPLATVDGTEHELAPGDSLIVPAHQPLRLSNPSDEPATLVCVLPVGGKAKIGDGEPFIPPWAA
jgi:quercetin dioxygenase-like cupin family protein